MSEEKSPSPIQFEAFQQFLKEFEGETDRASVILGAARLDYLLYRLLEGFLLTNPASQDPLFDSNGPLAAFGSKIDLCFRLGLIDSQFTRTLHQIRKIRNSFAHETFGAVLSSGAHRDRVHEIVRPLASKKLFREFREAFFGEGEDIRKDFRTMLTLLVARLEGAVEAVARVAHRQPLAILPPEQEATSPRLTQAETSAVGGAPATAGVHPAETR